MNDISGPIKAFGYSMIAQPGSVKGGNFGSLFHGTLSSSWHIHEIDVGYEQFIYAAALTEKNLSCSSFSWETS